VLLDRAEMILRENERYVLALAHALETYKTLSGEDVTAIFEGGRGPLVDGAPYTDDEFITRLKAYHVAAQLAHRDHSVPQLPLPAVTPAAALVSGSLLADGYGSQANGTPNGSGDGSGAPTYEPPSYGQPDGSA
jgi:cell division protease FtsH